MLDLKLRKTSILKVIEQSLLQLPENNKVVIDVQAYLEDESVWIDHDQIMTVLTDLEKNAIEAMPDGGLLTVTVHGDEKNLILTLTDTGRGISEENLPLLFTPFFTTKPLGEGTGLALPQAYSLVKTHNGNISIDSNADPSKGQTGTIVKITLPRKQTFQQKESKVILHEEE